MVFFGKLVTAMVTPYDKTGEVDYKKVQELVGHLQKTGSDGVLVCGTTGESATLSIREHIAGLGGRQRGDCRRLLLGCGNH